MEHCTWRLGVLGGFEPSHHHGKQKCILHVKRTWHANWCEREPVKPGNLAFSCLFQPGFRGIADLHVL